MNLAKNYLQTFEDYTGKPYLIKQNEINELEYKLEQVIALFERHLDTMSDINVHMGYKFTQPLINTRQALKKLTGN